MKRIKKNTKLNTNEKEEKNKINIKRLIPIEFDKTKGLFKDYDGNYIKMVRTHGTNLFGLKDNDKEAYCTALQNVFTQQLGAGQIYSYEIPSLVDGYIEEYESLKRQLDARRTIDSIRLNILQEEEDRLLAVTETYEMCDRVFVFILKDNQIEKLDQRVRMIIQTFGNYQKTELLTTQEMIKIMYAYYNPSGTPIENPDPDVSDITHYIFPDQIRMIDNPVHRTVVVGEKYSRLMFAVVNKTTPQFAMWCYLASRSGVEFSLHFEPAETDAITKELNKSHRNIQKNLRKEKDESNKQKLELDKDKIEKMMTSQVTTNDQPLYFLVAIRVSAYDEEILSIMCREIIKDMSRFGITMRAGFYETDKLFNTVAPICQNLIPHYMMTTTNDTLGFTYPFVFESLYDHQDYKPKSFKKEITDAHNRANLKSDVQTVPPIFLGNTVDTNGPVLYSNFNTSPDRASHNEFISGITGSGKTTCLMYLIRHRYAIGIKQFIVDVEGKELNKLTHALGGVNYNCASNLRGMINILQVRFQIPDDEKETEEAKKISLRELKPLSEHMRFIRACLKIYRGDTTEIQLLELNEIENCLSVLYKQMGIDYETSAEFILSHFKNEDYPTMKDLYNYMQQEYEMERNNLKPNENRIHRLELASAFISPMAIGADAQIFNGHTSIDLSNPTICFNISQLHDNTDNTLLQTQYFNILSFIWTQVVSNPDECWQQIYADEAHVVFDPRYFAITKFFENLVRRDRKYYCGLTTATQQPQDMLKDSVKEQGTSIINQSIYQFYFNLGGDAIEYFKGKNVIPKSEEEWIAYASQGQCYARFGNQTAMRINIKIPSETLNFFSKMKP